MASVWTVPPVANPTDDCVQWYSGICFRQEEISIMETPGHIGDQEVPAYDGEAARRHSREERWRRVRSLRLKNWFYSIFWPFLSLVVFVGCEIGLYFLVQLVPGLNPHEAVVCAIALQIAMWIIFMVSAGYAVYAPRNDAWIRHWGSRGHWGMSGQPVQKAKLHARYCATQNRGTAAIFLGYSALEVFHAWRNLNKPLPSHGPSMVDIEGLLISIVALVCLFLFLSCFRERLALGIGAAVFLIGLLVEVAPALAAPYACAVREICLFLWASAALTSLALLKSALRVPPPATPHL